jgi:hypothetical protein
MVVSEWAGGAACESRGGEREQHKVDHEDLPGVVGDVPMAETP